MTIAFAAVISGLALLVWSADHFVEGAALTARYFGMPRLLIGMVIVGFGTSAPELAVSALSAIQGNPGLALGNAYGSNISNIALIVGITALISPITVHSQVVRKELPILILMTVLAAFQVQDGTISREDAVVLLVTFSLIMGWSIFQGLRSRDTERNGTNSHHTRIPIGKALGELMAGLLMLVVSSRILVWGAVEIARQFGVDDLIIGLTIVALGTSLPELASSIIAARKGEHDIALGNIVGSNLFNTLAVVGLAGVIKPISVGPQVLHRDILVMGCLTLFLCLASCSFGGRGRINRFEGFLLLMCYCGYTGYLLFGAFGS